MRLEAILYVYENVNGQWSLPSIYSGGEGNQSIVGYPQRKSELLDKEGYPVPVEVSFSGICGTGRICSCGGVCCMGFCSTGSSSNAFVRSMFDLCVSGFSLRRQLPIL